MPDIPGISGTGADGVTDGEGMGRRFTASPDEVQRLHPAPAARSSGQADHPLMHSSVLHPCRRPDMVQIWTIPTAWLCPG